MRSYLQTGLVIMAGVLGAVSATADMDHDMIPMYRKYDMREAILRRFLKASAAPVETDTAAFIVEADEHHLDWRLLPSLAIVESGGGKTSRRNNPFGWNNGASRFTSARDAIHHVAEALEESSPYKGKNLRGKLKAYNRNPGYRQLVTNVMRQISPAAVAEGL